MIVTSMKLAEANRQNQIKLIGIFSIQFVCTIKHNFVPYGI